MSDETTTEQLADTSGRDIVQGLVLQVADLIQREEAEIEEQAESTPATEYTPPEGWRVLQVGERLRDGDMTVRKDGYCYSTERVGYFVGANQRYIRPIEPQPQPQPEPQHNGLIRDVTHLLQESGVLDSAKFEQQIEELRSEVSYVQRLLGESRQRVTQLEELVASLRTINEAQEKAFTAANNANDDLQHRLNVLAAEWAEQAETSRRLQIELDAAQQVPADSPELRQLRADLAEVIQERDTYRHAHERVLSDLETIRETTKAETVEAIAEWVQPFRSCNSPALASLLLEALPSIMRHLTGLTPED